MNYLVLIGDIVSSKKLLNRNEIQKKLSRTFDQLNATNKSIISPYTITIGDEFQAVYSSPNFVFRDVFKILTSLYPVKVRFSFGIGRILTEINSENALGMDGTAFYLARDGIEELKRSSNLFVVNGITGSVGNLVNQSLEILSIQCCKWKQSRMNTFNYHLQELPVKEISKNVGLSDKAIYKTIKHGMLDIFTNELLEIETLIKQMMDS